MLAYAACFYQRRLSASDNDETSSPRTLAARYEMTMTCCAHLHLASAVVIIIISVVVVVDVVVVAIKRFSLCEHLSSIISETSELCEQQPSNGDSLTPRGRDSKE